jgi:hypothetical protein
MGMAVEWPMDLFVFQRGADGFGEVTGRVRLQPGQTVRCRLETAAGQPIGAVNAVAGPDGLATAVFRRTPPGFYRLSFASACGRAVVRAAVGELFLVAGQSNAVSTNLGHPPPESATGMVVVNDYYEDQGPGAGKAVRSLARLLVPTGREPITSNVCWTYCGDMLAKRTGVPVGFLNLAVSGVESGAWNPTTGPLAGALFDAQRLGGFRAVLWQQGESDVLGGLSEEQSFTNLKSLIQASRAVTPGSVWVVARNSLKTQTPYAQLPVRRAQESIIGEGLALPGPDTDQVRENPKWVGKADFGAGGLRRNGELWFEALEPIVRAR